jgi:hypothetical protein
MTVNSPQPIRSTLIKKALFRNEKGLFRLQGDPNLKKNHLKSPKRRKNDENLRKWAVDRGLPTVDNSKSLQIRAPHKD